MYMYVVYVVSYLLTFISKVKEGVVRVSQL
jgi:hypothetical protein